MLLEGLSDPNEGDSKISWQSLQKTIAPPIYQVAKDFIKSSKKLFQTYEKICRDTTSNGELLDINGEWDEDCWKLNGLFDSRRQTTRKNLNTILKRKRASSQERQLNEDSTTGDDEIWTIFALEHSGEKERAKKPKTEHWAAAAKRVEVGVRRLVKHLEDPEW